MTGKALSVNKEWNTKLVSTSEGEMYKNINDAFHKLWNDPRHTRRYSDFIVDYRQRYETVTRQRKIALEASKKIGQEQIAGNTNVVSLERYRLKPNDMQIDFIGNLKQIIAQGENKALLISATG